MRVANQPEQQGVNRDISRCANQKCQALCCCPPGPQASAEREEAGLSPAEKRKAGARTDLSVEVGKAAVKMYLRELGDRAHLPPGAKERIQVEFKRWNPSMPSIRRWASKVRKSEEGGADPIAARRSLESNRVCRFVEVTARPWKLVRGRRRGAVASTPRGGHVASTPPTTSPPLSSRPPSAGSVNCSNCLSLFSSSIHADQICFRTCFRACQTTVSLA